MASNLPKPARQHRRGKDRKATEQELLDACERLLLRDGPDGIGLNNVVADAGVGKDLIYRYFGGLPGLITAWVEQRAHWPMTEELIGSDTEAFQAKPLKAKFRIIWHGYVRALRARPVVMRIMASELMHPTDITRILESASDRIGRELEAFVSNIDPDERVDVANLSLVFYTMLNYLCMRAVTSPHCFGMDLENDASWDHIEAVMDDLIERFFA
jgi:AcrR family transcriptional regulator